MSKLTPMMEQYFQIKNEYKDCLVLFRLGDFYELFFEDATVASRELDIVLTGKSCGLEERAPMCGVPYHSADGYIARLVEKGYKVAICEQTEDAKQTKTLVKREVVRIVTPGTITDTNMLDESKNNYVMTIFEDKSGFGLSFADVTTGEFLTTEVARESGKNIFDHIARYSPREIIVNPEFSELKGLEIHFGIKAHPYQPWFFEKTSAYRKIMEHFGVLNLNGFGLEGKEHSICSSGALLQYLTETQKNSLEHISSIKIYSEDKFMGLDISSRRNLELTETIREKGKKGSLMWVLDKTKTAPGARLLRKWIEQPLLNIQDINRRLDGVEELLKDTLLREELKGLLNTIHDIERLMGRVTYETCNARDMVSLKKSFQYLPDMKTLLSTCKSPLNREMYENLDELRDIYSMIGGTICEEPPFSVREGGFIRDGVNEELDKLRKAKNGGTSWLLELEAKEREETGIKNLRIKYNKIFGYYIEVTNSYQNLVPDRYIRRQTLANCERYTTGRLKEIEDEILGADGRIVELEYELFVYLRKEIAENMLRIQLTAQIIATLDVICSFADVAYGNGYVKPEINDSGVIDIKEGRHPVVERVLEHAFVPNDIYLDRGQERVSIITGPNMAGKSTYMRQAATIVIMAQIGSFIPADSGKIGVVDRIFTRVGASDDLATGQSTFMIEMSEVANILNNATANSLLILDEVGRGTSTFDGLSIAWSVLEYIAEQVGAKTLFSTHYHELTELEGKVDGVRNYCVTVREQGDDVIFLRKIARGGADNSYGIHVARLAGLPKTVLERSEVIMNALNNADIVKRPPSEDHPDEIVHYNRVKKRDNEENRIIINEIAGLDVDSLTPRDALKKLYELNAKTKDFIKGMCE